MKKKFGSVTSGNKGNLYKNIPSPWYFSYLSCQIRGENIYSCGCLPIKIIMYGGEKSKHWQLMLLCYQKIQASDNIQLHWKAISIEILIWLHLCEIPMCCKMDLKDILKDHLCHSSSTDTILRSATFPFCAVTKAGQIFPATIQKKIPARFWSSLNS